MGTCRSQEERYWHTIRYLQQVAFEAHHELGQSIQHIHMATNQEKNSAWIAYTLFSFDTGRLISLETDILQYLERALALDSLPSSLRFHYQDVAVSITFRVSDSAMVLDGGICAQHVHHGYLTHTNMEHTPLGPEPQCTC